MLKKLFLTFVFAGLLHSSGAAAQAPSPQEWLNVRGTELLKVLSQPNTKKRFAQTLRLADNVFNAKELSRLALGRYWIEFSDAQKARYSDLFLKYFVVTYASSRLPLDSVSFKVGKTVPSGKDILVQTTVHWSGSTSDLQNEMTETAVKAAPEGGINLVFALRQINDDYYIRDFQLEGQSVLMFLRKKIEQEYKINDYSPDAMLASMQKTIDTTVANAEIMDQVKRRKK